MIYQLKSGLSSTEDMKLFLWYTVYFFVAISSESVTVMQYGGGDDSYVWLELLHGTWNNREF